MNMAFVSSFVPARRSICTQNTCCTTRSRAVSLRAEYKQKLSEKVATESPAIKRIASKYIFPMREYNTQVFFDNSCDDEHTLLIVFAKDRHGLVLDIVSVLKALGVCVSRTASSENDALQLLLTRIEGELVSVNGLHLSLANCVAFWVKDVETSEKIYDDGDRMEQIRTCIKFELQNAHPRPRPADESRWHRVSVQKNRANRYTVFSIQTHDQTGLLAALTSAFADLKIDVVSAVINTFAERVENTFYVTKSGFKCPLSKKDLEDALESVMRALLTVGKPADNETLWYQVRDGSEVLISEAIFIDEVNNLELAAFARHETPNVRGRLPDAPYRPVSLQ